MLDFFWHNFYSFPQVCQGNNVILIGDSASDLEMAKNANINFIGVTTGANSDEFIRNSEHLVENLLGIEVKKSY